MRKQTQNTVPFVPPLPYTETQDADTHIGDALAFLDAQERQQSGDSGVWAERWLAAYETAIDGLRVRYAGDVQVRPARHELKGEIMPMFRENFTTRKGGSIWAVYYTLDEDETGKAVRVVVRRVLHGRALNTQR